MNKVIETMVGDDFSSFANKAKQMSSNENITVEFDFNGCTCVVDGNTNLDWLFRDYVNHWVMGWSTVGPNCVENYDPETQSELNKRKAERDENRRLEQESYEKKKNKERGAFTKKSQVLQ